MEPRTNRHETPRETQIDGKPDYLLNRLIDTPLPFLHPAALIFMSAVPFWIAVSETNLPSQSSVDCRQSLA